MLTLIFTVLLIAFVFRLIFFALKCTWGIAKIIVTIVLFPVGLIVLAASGLMIIALPALIIAGIVLIVKKVAA